MTCMMSTELGAYLLGALSPEERAAVEAHLTGCARCRDDVVSLAPLPGLLARITVDDVDVAEANAAVAPPLVPPGPIARSPDASRRSALSRRLRPRLLAVAAAAVGAVILAGVLVFGGAGGSDVPASATTFTGSSDTTGVEASASLSAQPWGTGIRLRLDGVSSAQTCALVVHADDGREETAGAWTAHSYATLTDIPASTSIRPEDIDRLDIVTADGQTLVHLTTPSTAQNAPSS